MILRPIKTAAGRQATFNAAATGTELVLTHMSLGDKAGTLDPALKALRGERERVATFGQRISADQIHLDSLFDGPAEFWPREVGIWAGSTLVYYWSGAGNELGYKSGSGDWLIGIDLTIDPASEGPINITAAPANFGLTVMPHLATVLMSLNDTNRLVLAHRFRLDEQQAKLDRMPEPSEDPYTQYWTDQRGQAALRESAKAWGVDGARLVLEVGAGKEFGTIQAAYESLAGKALKTSVLIKVADGTYNLTGQFLGPHPHAHMIRIEGNPAKPSACTINWSADTNKASHGLIIRGARGLQLAGFRMTGQATADNWTHRSLRLDQGAQVWVEPGTLEVDGGCYGVQVEEMSVLWAERISIKNCADWHFMAAAGSHASIHGIKIDGGSKDASVVIPAHINPDMWKIVPSGILVQDSARAWAGESDTRRVFHGHWAQNAGYLWSDCSVVDDVHHGMIAKTSGVIWSHMWSVSRARPVAKRTIVRNAKTIAYQAHEGGRMVLPGARAEASDNGFYAATHSFIQANSSQAANCARAYYAETLSHIEAWDTSGNISSCATHYSPSAHGAFDNSGGMIRRS